MNLAEISKLTNREKSQLMDALWEDMSKKVGIAEIPPEHLELLEAR